MKALLSQYRQSPRKVRLVGDAIVGKSVSDALATLSVMIKRGASPLHKLVSSAVSNAKQQGIAAETLMIKRVNVDEGPTMKRIMPRARGSAAQILKRTSRVFVELAVGAPQKKGKRGKIKAVAQKA